MSKIGITRDILSNGVAVFQDVEWTVQGGFTLDKTGLLNDQIIGVGTPISFNELTRLARPLKGITLSSTAAATDTVYRVKKGSLVAIGENYSASTGGTSYAITAIDTSNPAYDSITFATTLGASFTVAGTTAFNSSANGAAAGAFNVPMVAGACGLLYQDITVGDNTTLSVVLDGVVYARRIPGYNSSLPALMPNIIFSQSY